MGSRLRRHGNISRMFRLVWSPGRPNPKRPRSGEQQPCAQGQLCLYFHRDQGERNGLLYFCGRGHVYRGWRRQPYQRRAGHEWRRYWRGSDRAGVHRHVHDRCGQPRRHDVEFTSRGGEVRHRDDRQRQRAVHRIRRFGRIGNDRFRNHRERGHKRIQYGQYNRRLRVRSRWPGQLEQSGGDHRAVCLQRDRHSH